MLVGMNYKFFFNLSRPNDRIGEQYKLLLDIRECTYEIVNYINTMSCPIKGDSNTIQLTVQHFLLLGLRLTLCLKLY